MSRKSPRCCPLANLTSVGQFGEIGIDDALVKQKFDTEEEIFEMNNGCICCTVRGDLVRILGRLIKRKATLDGIIIVRYCLVASALLLPPNLCCPTFP